MGISQQPYENKIGLPLSSDLLFHLSYSKSYLNTSPSAFLSPLEFTNDLQAPFLLIIKLQG